VPAVGVGGHGHEIGAVSDPERQHGEAEQDELDVQPPQLLNALRCELAQGWLYAPALPPGQIADLLGKRFPVSAAARLAA
jgi:hypothetical protein